MSYDLVFWKQSALVPLAPDEIAADLAQGIAVRGVETLPVADILRDLAAEFPGFDYAAGQSAIRHAAGTIDVYAAERYLNFMCYGDLDQAPARVARVLARFGCPLYDPQLDKRYDTDGGVQVGELPDETCETPLGSDIVRRAAAMAWSAPVPPAPAARSAPAADAIGPARNPLTSESCDAAELCGPVAVSAQCLFVAGPASLRAWSFDWREIWRADLPADVNSLEPEGERLYVTTGNSISSQGSALLAIDAASGKILWSRAIRSPAHEMPPRVAGELVFVGNTKKLVSLETAKGKPRWEYAISHAAPPLVFCDRQLIVVANASGLAALDAGTGQLVWQRAWDYVRAARMDNELWAWKFGQQLQRLDLQSGETLQKLDVEAHTSTLLDDSRTIYCSTYHDDNEAYLMAAINPATGARWWEVDLPRQAGNGRWNPNPQFFHNGCVVVETPLGPVYGLRVRDGGMQWRVEAANIDPAAKSASHLGPVICTPHDSWLLAAGRRWKLDI